jgi:transcriptional regulator with XRE-family HTH domain
MPAIDPAKLREARERAGLSREQVAIALGKSFHTIQAYEIRPIIPPGNVLVALAGLYGVTVEDLCRDQAPAGAR